jgi:hypothetical protein
MLDINTLRFYYGLVLRITHDRNSALPDQAGKLYDEEVINQCRFRDGSPSES